MHRSSIFPNPLSKPVTGIPSRSTNEGSTNQKYASIKYNRISSPKEDAYETHSNPISTPFVVSVDEPGDTDRMKKHSYAGSVGGWTGTGSGNGTGSNLMSTLEAPSMVNTGPKKHLSLLPPSLHISFDVEPENNRAQQFGKGLPISQSSDNVRRYERFGSVSSAGTNAQTITRPSTFYRRQYERRNLLQQSEIAQISAGYMRATGAVQQFRRILAAPDKTPTLLSKVLNKQHSKEKEKEDSNVATPISINRNFVFGPSNVCGNSLDDVKPGVKKTSIITDGDYKAPVTSSVSNGATGINGVSPFEVATVEATLDAFKLPPRRTFQRHLLFDQRRKACDYSCLFAVSGIVLMILENEFTAAGLYTKSSPYSYGLKSLIVLSTFVLLTLIITYHALVIQLTMVDLGCSDWRILMNTKRIIQIIFELSACMICPIPGDYHFAWRTVHHDGKTVTSTLVPIDVLLSIPMFLRLYLFCRFMLLHSKLFTDAPSRSIGAMNRVNFTARFVLKTLMTMSPGTVLLIFTASFWTTAAWIMLLCERHHGFSYPSAGNGFESNKTIMHYEAIKHQLKNSAANVLRETWLIYKHRKMADKMDASKIRYHQRKFLIAIYEMRRVKRGQRKLNENSTTVADMAKTTCMMYEMIADMRSWQQEMEEKISGMDQRCEKVEAYMRQLQISIRCLPELVARKLQSPSSAAIVKPNSQATSLCESHPSATQSTDAHHGSGYLSE